jgi:ammonium transporter Rh
MFGTFQLLLVVLYFLWTEYDDNSSPKTPHDKATGGEEMAYYPMFQDIHVMIFIGFGFLMTFLRSYAFSALTLNFLIGVFAIQWGILCMGFFDEFFHNGGSIYGMEKIPLHMGQLIEGDFAAATALISLGAILGKSTPLQTLIMVAIECVFYSVNYQV